MEYEIGKLKKYIEEKNTEAVKWLMTEHNLKLVDGKLVPGDIKKAKYWKDFWNQRQQARKILLEDNSI